jgi:hypothetical protein
LAIHDHKTHFQRKPFVRLGLEAACRLCEQQAYIHAANLTLKDVAKDSFDQLAQVAI